MVNQPLIDALLPALSAVALPEKAAWMQAYMKSAMPYLGVPMPVVRKTVSALIRTFPFDSVAQLRSTAQLLWRTASVREQRYSASMLTEAELARGEWSLLPLYEEMISTGAWWDHVDALAHRSLELLQAHRADMEEVIRRWSTDPDFWFRRSAIISQLGAKNATDTGLLATVITANKADQEFFIRKGIGWALRDYAKTNPGWVLDFTTAYAGELSPLSLREALRNIR